MMTQPNGITSHMTRRSVSAQRPARRCPTNRPRGPRLPKAFGFQGSYNVLPHNNSWPPVWQLRSALLAGRSKNIHAYPRFWRNLTCELMIGRQTDIMTSSHAYQVRLVALPELVGSLKRSGKMKSPLFRFRPGADETRGNVGPLRCAAILRRLCQGRFRSALPSGWHHQGGRQRQGPGDLG